MADMRNEKVESTNEISPELQGSVLRGILGSIAGMFEIGRAHV